MTPLPQQLATEFFSKYYSIGIKPVQVESTNDQPDNRYALQIQYGNKLYPDYKTPYFFINEETLKDAVVMFLVEDSLHGSEFEYPVTDDLINAVFAIIKAKMHSSIAMGHIQLLLDPDALKNLLDDGKIGQSFGFVVTADEEEQNEENNEREQRN